MFLYYHDYQVHNGQKPAIGLSVQRCIMQTIFQFLIVFC